MKPFVDEGQPIHNYFLDREFAVLIPTVLLILALTIVFTFLAIVMIKSGKKSQKKTN